MKKKLITWHLSLLLLLSPVYLPVVMAPMLTSGCATSQSAYKSLNIVATSVDAGMRAFADAVVAGKVGQPTQAKVRDLHGRYSKAMQAAIAAARFDTSSPTPENVTALATELLTLITELAKGTK